jgi:hypothetical protein
VELDRKRLLLGYALTVVGLFLAYVVAEVIPTPAPPACYTATCTAADLASLIGLFAIILGILILTLALFRGRGTAEPPVQAFPGPQYALSPTPPGGAAPPLPAPAGAPPLSGQAVQHCPACGAPLTSNYGFCPRCGRTLSK